MQDPHEIQPVSRPVRGSIRPPGSKSLTNRALITAALADGSSLLRGVLDSEDTRVMVESLRRLGFEIEHDVATATLRIAGGAGRDWPPAAELWLENSGTSIRFLAALCALGRGTYRLDGNPRMRERPIGPLADALAAWGARIECEGTPGCPPLRITTTGLPGGRVSVSGGLSSQYLSALLMAAPRAAGPVEIHVAGPLVSRPYVDMTLAVMCSFGGEVRETREGVFEIPARGYKAAEYDIEPDASAASYFFAAAAVTGGEVTIPGLSRRSLQGDVRFVDVLQQMGCTATWTDDALTVRGGPLRGVDVDLNDISDTAQTLAAIAPLAEGPTRIRNVEHIRHKETDRVAALVAELRRLGVTAEEHADGLSIVPGPTRPAEIHTYNDHRMAMSFAILGLCRPGIRITNPGCTSKTYPHFFRDLARLCEPAS